MSEAQMRILPRPGRNGSEGTTETLTAETPDTDALRVKELEKDLAVCRKRIKTLEKDLIACQRRIKASEQERRENRRFPCLRLETGKKRSPQ